MRLSKKGWNNVLIFGILLIIFIFNFGHQLLLKPKSSQRSVIPESATIVEIKTPDFSIKRVGREWQGDAHLGLSTQQIALLVQNWQNILLPTREAAIAPQSSFIIHIYLANQEQPIVIQLIQQGDNYLLQNSQNQALLLQAKQLPLFLGR